jgi:hypothetical protein
LVSYHVSILIKALKIVKQRFAPLREINVLKTKRAAEINQQPFYNLNKLSYPFQNLGITNCKGITAFIVDTFAVDF